MILYDRNTELNPNGCILGMPGAGKSFTAKREMINVLLNTYEVFIRHHFKLFFITLHFLFGTREQRYHEIYRKEF